MNQPPSLLAVPTDTDFVLPKKIKHTRVAQVMNELDTLIYEGSQSAILMLCGPSGVGKSELAEHLCEVAPQKYAGEMAADAGMIPAVYLEAPVSGEDDFSWRTFYRELLEKLEGTQTMPRAAYGIDAETGRVVKPFGPSNNSLAAQRIAVERALRARKTRFLVIDEAAHIIRQSRKSKLHVQLDTLKSLANRCGTQIVLVGSYDLYPLVKLSAQLARRIHVVHFERYQQGSDADCRAFKACVQKFQNALPALWGNQLMQHAEALHENTLGCIGILHDVLERAMKLAQQAGAWSDEILLRGLMTEGARRQILDEILDGEAAINPSMTRMMSHARTTLRQKKDVA